MARRKPRAVQHKRPLQAAADADPSVAHVSGGSATRLKNKKRRKQDALREVDGVCFNDTDQSIALTLDKTRRRSDGDGWDDALWLGLPVCVSGGEEGVAVSFDFKQAVLHALQVSKGGRMGLEIGPASSHLTLIDCVSMEKTETALTTLDAFPGAYSSWVTRALDLVTRRLVTFELELVADGDESTTLVWRVGVAWRLYTRLCNAKSGGNQNQRVAPPVVALPRVELHVGMHRVMLWILKHSRSPLARRLYGDQCCFEYWSELELLYDRFVGENAVKVEDISQDATSAVSDLYTKIDTKRQLERNVDAFDAAIDRASERYRETSRGSGEDIQETALSVLVPTLRPYQKAAVSWMLEREQGLDGRVASMKTSNSTAIGLCVTFPGVENALEVREYVAYDPHCGAFVDWRTDDAVEDGRTREHDLSRVCGGILADEMGLGKTVEVISLVLSHPNSVSVPVLQYAGVSTEKAAEDEDGDVELDGELDMDCICGTSDAHDLGVVQCDLCGTWHHQICSGFATTSSSSRGVWTFDRSPSEDREPFTFMCLHCQIRERPWFSSKTTLIVSPEAIHDQWEAELKRHVRSRDAISLLRYPGVKTLRSRLGSGPSAEWQVLSTAGLRLATYDIVLTTYEALRSDLYHLPSPDGRDRRASTRQKRKKYAFVASPLVFLEFWRVCMDEAQLGVESATAQTALTIAQLRARSAWVVTGTPFSKSSSISDLFGYLKFLGVEPFASGSESFFRDIVASAFSAGAIDRVLDLLLWDGRNSRGSGRQCDGGGLLWRTGKRDVLDQLDLPAQRSLVVWCRFSQVERHFYEQQERAIVSLVRQRERLRAEQLESDGDAAVIDGRDRIWHDLLELRKICCHPQIGNAFGAGSGAGLVTLNGRRLAPTTVLTMDEFLRELIARNKRECEEAQRKLVAARNGLAAMRLLASADDLDGEAVGVVAAIQEYLTAVELIQTNWTLFRADLLPRLHILENLARLVRQQFGVGSSTVERGRSDGDSSGARSEEGEDAETHLNPKQHHLLPLLPVLSEQLAMAASGDASWASSSALELECARLDQSASRIRQFYLLQVENAHGLAKRAFETLEGKIAIQTEPKARASSNRQELLCSSSMWWSDALAVIERSDAGEQADRLVARVHARLAAFGTKWTTRFCSQLVSVRTLRLQLVTELEALAKRRRSLFDALKALSAGTPSRDAVRRSGNCRKCRDAGTGPVCAHCKLYKELDAYRQHLLGIDSSASSSSLASMLADGGGGQDLFEDEEDLGDGEDDRQASSTPSGTAAASLLVEVLKEIAASARAVSKQAQASLSLADTSTHLQREVELFALLLREWTAAKKLFQTQHQRLGALDELEMASSQIRLRVEGEPVETAAEKLYIIDAFAVPTRLAELETDRSIADRELRDSLAQLRFLLQLSDEQHKSAAASGTGDASASAAPARRECAVCLQDMDGNATRAVLLCAHAFCCSCVETMAKPRHGLSVKCPTCRRVTPADRVAIVHNNASPLQQPRLQAQTPSAGSGFGSKMDALLRCVRSLVARDADVKCLLFSQWPDMLWPVARYVRDHVDGISCFVYSTKRAFPALLRGFKACPRACVLALPFSVGANGLNIVEATEVLLVEPLLNASTEVQAISRVHRIGQSRPTNVHRFIVEATVEERIHWLGKTRHQLARARQRGNSGGEGLEQSDSRSGVLLGSNGVQGERVDAEGEEEGGSDDDDTSGAAAGRQARHEKLTMRDLHVLLDGKTSGDHSDAATSASVFWQEDVVLNGRPTRRELALQFFERRHALDMRAGLSNQSGVGDQDGGRRSTQVEPTTRLFDRQVRLRVANELLALRSAHEEDQAPGARREAIASELVALHRARVQEELARWVAAQGRHPPTE